MIFVPLTGGKIQIITSAAGAVHVHASFLDVDAAGAVTAGYENNIISTAATTDVVDPPGAGKYRNVKSLMISNAHASTANTVTIQHTDGTTTVEIEKVTLLAGERISFREGVPTRVVNANGIERTVQDARPYFNANTADVVANAANTYLTGSQLPTAGRLVQGAHFKWRFRLSKTAAGTAANALTIKHGTAQTTADATVITHTFAAATAAIDTGIIELDAIVRAAGASTVLQSSMALYHQSAGFTTAGNIFLTATSAAFDSTVANSILGVADNPGTAGVWTFQMISVEANGLLP
jgi:hypothetical protein